MRVDEAPNLADAFPVSGAAQPEEPTAKDQFLRLLVAQLEHQDPLEPQSGAEFVAQLAQFAAIEVGMETNERLAAIEAGQETVSRTSLAGVVGRTITARADNIRIDPSAGPPPPLSIELAGAAESASVIVYDKAGNEVKRIDVGAAGAGRTSVAWDGTDKKGIPLAEGDYTIKVVATGKDGTQVTGQPLIEGLVNSLVFADGATLFSVGSLQVTPADIESIAGGI